MYVAVIQQSERVKLPRGKSHADILTKSPRDTVHVAGAICCALTQTTVRSRCDMDVFLD